MSTDDFWPGFNEALEKAVAEHWKSGVGADPSYPTLLFPEDQLKNPPPYIFIDDLGYSMGAPAREEVL